MSAVLIGVPAALAAASPYISWTNLGSGTIGEANLGGTGANESLITGASEPSGAAVTAQVPIAQVSPAAGSLSHSSASRVGSVSVPATGS